MKILELRFGRKLVFVKEMSVYSENGELWLECVRMVLCSKHTFKTKYYYLNLQNREFVRDGLEMLLC